MSQRGFELRFMIILVIILTHNKLIPILNKCPIVFILTLSDYIDFLSQSAMYLLYPIITNTNIYEQEFFAATNFSIYVHNLNLPSLSVLFVNYL